MLSWHLEEEEEKRKRRREKRIILTTGYASGCTDGCIDYKSVCLACIGYHYATSGCILDWYCDWFLLLSLK